MHHHTSARCVPPRRRSPTPQLIEASGVFLRKLSISALSTPTTGRPSKPATVRNTHRVIVALRHDDLGGSAPRNRCPPANLRRTFRMNRGPRYKRLAATDTLCCYHPNSKDSILPPNDEHQTSQPIMKLQSSTRSLRDPFGNFLVHSSYLCLECDFVDIALCGVTMLCPESQKDVVARLKFGLQLRAPIDRPESRAPRRGYACSHQAPYALAARRQKNHGRLRRLRRLFRS